MKLRAVIPALLVFASAAPALTDPGNNLPPREITMRECVETALRNNVDVAVSRMEKEIGALGIPVEKAAFLPRFSGEIGAGRSIIPTGSVLDNSLSVDQRTYTLDLGVRDLLLTGTSLSFAFENQRQESDSAVSLLSPEYRTALTLRAQQPLLKNFGRKVTGAPLAIARAGAAEKTEEWKAAVMDVVAAARTAFLAFYTAAGEVEVRRGALDLAERLLVQTDARIEAGSMAPMDRLPADAAAAARREELLRAEAAAQGAADDLRIVLGIRDDAEWGERIFPAELTAEIPPPGKMESFEEALRRRPEFSAQAARESQAEIREAVARNQALPSLDLSLSAGLSGLSGSPNPSPLFPSSTVGEFDGGYGESLDQAFSGRYYNWFVGLSTEIPWRLEREKAEWARARAAAAQQRLLGESLSSKIRVEVRKARRDLASALARIEAGRASAASAAKQLEAEERKLELGRSIVFQVLRYQQDLSEARLALLRARTDAYAAQTRLWRAVGTILEKEGIVVR